MLLHRSFIPNETALVAFLFRHAVHFTNYQVDLLICFSGRMLLFTRLYCQQLWQILVVAVMHLPVGTSGSGWLHAIALLTVKWHTALPVTACTSKTQSCQSACLHPPWQTWGRESQVGASPDVTQLRCSLTRWTSLTLLPKYDDRNPPDSLVCIPEVIKAVVSVSGEIREPCSVNLPLVSQGQMGHRSTKMSCE